MKPEISDKRKQVVALLDTAYKGRINNLSESIRLVEKALAVSRKLSDKKLVAQSLSYLSLFYMINGEHQKSMGMAEEAISLYTELKDEKGIADVKYNLAGIYYKTDNFHLGLAYLMDCLPVYKKHNDYFNLARVEKSMGTIYEYIGDQKNAVASYENSIAAAIKCGDPNLEANVYNPLSSIYLKEGNVRHAMEIIQKSVSIKTASGDIRGLAFALYGRGKVYAHTGLYEEAVKDYKKALQIHLDNGEKLGTAMTYRKMGELYDRMGLADKAKKTFKKAFDYSSEHNIAIIKIKSAYHLYLLYKHEKNISKSLHYLEEYIKQREAVINTQTLKVIENYEMKSKMETLEKEAQLQKEKAEIIEKKNIAEQANRVRQEFLSTMSHEIRTPLNAVITISSLLKDSVDEEEKQLLNSLRFASGNLLQIINDILDFSKLESGKAQLELRPTHFGKLMQNIFSTYNSMAVEKGLQLHMQLDTQLAEAYEIDETKLSQIMGNLLSNAVKYTEKGRIDLSITRQKTSAPYDIVRCSVADTGVGISPKNLKRIFEEFFQPEVVTTRRENGTGLGLAIVKKLVELHDSKIHATSKPGIGSVFYFDLKLKKAELQQQAAARTLNKLKGKTVLLAEDNPINAMVATKLLGSWGVLTDHVVNGYDAITKAKAKKYDYILMDLHMPGMNGYDATRGIRKRGNPNAKTLIYALTADITADQEEEYISLFNGFLRKPIEIDHMYDTLAAML